MTTDTTTNDWTTVAETISVCRADELPRERCDWSRPTVARSASFAARTASSTRSRIGAPTTTGRSRRASSTRPPARSSVHGTARCSTSAAAGRRRSRRSSRSDTFAARVEDGEVEAGGLELSPWLHPETQTPPGSPKELTEEERALKGIGSDYAERFGFHDPETDYAYKAPKGFSREVVESISSVQGRAGVDARVPAQGPRPLHAAPDPDLGRQPRPDRLRQHPLLRPRLGEEQPQLGRGPRRHQEHLRPARDPRGRAQVPLRGRRPVRVGGRLSPGERGAREAGRDLHGHGHCPAGARGPRARVLGHRDPAERQQARGAQLGRLVGRVLRLRPRRASRWTCRSRPTSGSTPRTWASSSAP